MRRTTIGSIQVRDVEGQPGRFEGLAIPYNVTIDVAYGRERFVRGAFSEAVRSINAGERVAYLNRHGEDGGIPVGVVSGLQERDAGLYFSGEFLDVPEVAQVRSTVGSGINGVSVEFVPGRMRRKGDVIEHFEGARLAAIASSYAPAYRQARVALRNVHGGSSRMPNLTASALTERRDSITSQISAIRSVAEAEDRALDETETRDVETLTARIVNVDALIADANSEAQRRDVERRSLPQQRAGGSSPAIVTRSETIYGPGTGHSFFGDLAAATFSRDAEAMTRQSRHKLLIGDLAQQIERRAVDSADLAGAYPTTYYPDLYVPDLAYTGPLTAFFPTTPITAPLPIIVPVFDTVTGDTQTQNGENTPVGNVDVTTRPIAITPGTIGGEAIVSRQSVDGASPGTDIIIGTQLRELLMRDNERVIAFALEALDPSGAIGDTAGAAGGGADLHRGIASTLGKFYAGDDVGGVNARFLPAEGVFLNTVDWNNLVMAEDLNGRPLLAYINPVNSQGQVTGAGFQRGVIGGVPVEPAWAFQEPITEIFARRNDARQWKSTVLEIRMLEREGPQSIVFAIWQYLAFLVLQPKGVRKYTYTNV